MKVAIILPSRGLIFSQTADEILQNVREFNYFGGQCKFFFSHRKPIPECFEEPTKRALKDKSITHLWFIEDDMVLPSDTLRNMVKQDANVVTHDYPITKDGKGSVFYDNGSNVVFCGTGCMLVKREVFDHLNKPYFTDKVRWTMLNYGEAVKLVASPNDDKDGYGLHDITFCMKLWKQGINIKVMPGVLGQRKLIALGKAGTNDGAHQIETWKKVKKDLRLKDIQGQPIATGAKSKLVTVDTPTGQVRASQRHAGLLVGKGLAKYPAKRYTIIDDSAVIL